MQTGRTKRQSNILDVESKLEEVQEKRAATCHTRNRKKFVSQKDKIAKMVRLKEEKEPLFKEEIETANRFMRYKQEKQEDEAEKE